MAYADNVFMHMLVLLDATNRKKQRYAVIYIV